MATNIFLFLLSSRARYEDVIESDVPLHILYRSYADMPIKRCFFLDTKINILKDYKVSCQNKEANVVSVCLKEREVCSYLEHCAKDRLNNRMVRYRI